MKYATPRARITAFWLDALIVVTMILGLGRVIWEVMPGATVRESAMQFYSAREFRVFFANGAMALLVLWGYFSRLPASSLGATLGQRLARIYVARPDGTPLTPLQRGDRVAMALFKAMAVLFGGPMLAALGGNFGLSVVGLVAPVVGLLVTSALAWSDPEGAGPFERSGQYRYFSTE